MRIALPRVLCLALVSLFTSAATLSQQFVPRPLITQPINEGQTVTLRGNTHPLAQAQYEVGPAPQNLSLQRMLLVLKRDPQRGFALHKLLDDQQDKNSPNYHKWVSPDEFGIQFGPSDQDVQLVTGWLATHGFQVNRISHGRTLIEFSGFEAQVEQAFHTQIRQYFVNGQLHWANATDPQIPAALAPAVMGVWSLHDFRKKPASQFSQTRVPIPLATGSSGHHFLMPGDYAIIYDINSLYSFGIEGQNAKVAVVARSGFNWYDVYSFHNIAGIPTNVNIINDGPNPGVFDQGEEAEAVLDATWASAIAYDAQTNVVISASTDTTDGVDLSELYIIDNNIGDVMTESFGACEAFFTSAEAAGIGSLAEQAAAQGITYMVSSGDSGAEGCDRPDFSPATGPVSPNMLASSPYNISVGGTMFNENGNTSKYWSSTNSSTLTSAKSYIPENVWNESCSTCGLWASGGGVSTFFSKPTWQFGVLGIPTDGVRDQPDVSLTAAGHDAYLICFENSCSQGLLAGIAGTSASAPSFAGIMALVVQQYGRQGQANYVLYRLAAGQTPSQCNGSNTTTPPAASCIFNDITKGNNAVPGEPGYGTASAKYQAATGFDLATGLGSVNVTNLFNKWNTVTFNATTTTLVPSSISGTHGSPVTLNVSVAPNGGSGTPTGDVSLLTSTNQGVGFLTLTNGAASSAIRNLPGGNYTLSARYGGDGSFAPSPPSSAASVNITPENSSTTLSLFTTNQSGNLVPFTGGPYGGFVYLQADVAGQSGFGTPAGTVSFQDGNYVLGPLGLNSQGSTATPTGYFAFSVGQHSVTAQYQGDNSFNTSASAAVSFAITQATTSTTVAASASGATQGSTVNLTATVASPAFAGLYGNVSPFNGESTGWPSGTVTFYSGNIQIGMAQPAGQQATSSGFISTFSMGTSSLPVGQNTITAQYSGDLNYIASSAAPVTVTVAADFNFSVGSSSITVTKPGGTASNTLTITGQAGYNSTINFSSTSCAGLPLYSKCAFSPSTIGGSGNSTVTITTTAPSGALRLVPWTGTGIFFAGVLMLASRLRRRTPAVLVVLLCAIALGNMACGGGSGRGGGGGSPGTPTGNYNVVVTATTTDGVVSHSAGFTLVVQ